MMIGAVLMYPVT